MVVSVLANHEITGPGPDRGVVFQSPCLMPWMTAIENVLLGVNQVYPAWHQGGTSRHLQPYYLNLVGPRQFAKDTGVGSVSGHAATSRDRSGVRA